MQENPPAPEIAKKKGFPQEGELVLAEITSVYPTSAFAKLEEYEGHPEGMIHIGEISSSWVKNIRSVVKEGKKIVCLVMMVDREKRHINLSLKRVSETDKRQKFEQVKRAKKTTKMLEAAGGLAAGIIERLEKEYTEVYFAFEAAARHGAGALVGKGIDPATAATVERVGKASITFQDVDLKANVTLSSFDPAGVDAVKRILALAEKRGAGINYISAPKYRLSITAADYKTAERRMRELAEEMGKLAKGGGSFDFTIVKEGNKEEEVRL